MRWSRVACLASMWYLTWDAGELKANVFHDGSSDTKQNLRCANSGARLICRHRSRVYRHMTLQVVYFTLPDVLVLPFLLVVCVHIHFCALCIYTDTLEWFHFLALPTISWVSWEMWSHALALCGPLKPHTTAPSDKSGGKSRFVTSSLGSRK